MKWLIKRWRIFRREAIGGPPAIDEPDVRTPPKRVAGFGPG